MGAAGLGRALPPAPGEPDWAAEADTLGSALRERVRAEWTGRWFRRARCGDLAVGDDTLFLEVQSWAILCGAADELMGRRLLETINERLRRNSPLGARQHWPLGDKEPFPRGEALTGGIWFSLQHPLIWAAAKLRPELAVDEWNRFTLGAHAEAYPAVWEGTISGPDSSPHAEAATSGTHLGLL